MLQLLAGEWRILQINLSLDLSACLILPIQKPITLSIAALVGGGSLLRWFRDNFAQLERIMEKDLGVDAYRILNIEAEKAPPGSNGLLVLPYFMG